jgi:hypothetical protein
MLAPNLPSSAWMEIQALQIQQTVLVNSALSMHTCVLSLMVIFLFSVGQL